MISFEQDDTVYEICFVSLSWNINNELCDHDVYYWHQRQFINVGIIEGNTPFKLFNFTLYSVEQKEDIFIGISFQQ